MAKYFRFPFAVAGTKTAIPDDTQPSGSVSYELGWTADYELDLATNPSAKPIPRDQMNELFYDITDAIKQYQTHGVPDFITAAENDGVAYSYDIYAQVRYDAGSGFQVYESIVGSNTSLPTDTTKWVVISGGALGAPVGLVAPFMRITAPTGWLPCDGSAVSRTTYASLFAACTQTFTCTTTNASATVTTASTATIYDGMAVEGTGIPAGATLTVIDGTTFTLSAAATASGTPTLRFFNFGAGDGSTTFNIANLNRRTPVGSGGSGSTTLGAVVGSAGGSETRTLSTENLPPHDHTYLYPNTGANDFDTGGGAGAWNNVTSTGTSGNGPGSSQPFSIMQPSLVMLMCVKF